MKAAKIATISILATLGLAFGVAVYAHNTHEAPEQPEIVAQAVEKPYTPPTPEEILELVNKEREKVGVSPLKMMPEAMQSAQYKAEDMVKRDYFAHEDPDTGRNNGLDYLDEIDDDKCRYVSENIYWKHDNRPTADGAVSWWNNSKPHYEAMINPDYTSSGVGISDGKVVQHFCIVY